MLQQTFCSRLSWLVLLMVILNPWWPGQGKPNKTKYSKYLFVIIIVVFLAFASLYIDVIYTRRSLFAFRAQFWSILTWWGHTVAANCVSCTFMMWISHSITSWRCSVELNSRGHFGTVNSLSFSKNPTTTVWDDQSFVTWCYSVGSRH